MHITALYPHMRIAAALVDENGRVLSANRRGAIFGDKVAIDGGESGIGKRGRRGESGTYFYYRRVSGGYLVMGLPTLVTKMGEDVKRREELTAILDEALTKIALERACHGAVDAALIPQLLASLEGLVELLREVPPIPAVYLVQLLRQMQIEVEIVCEEEERRLCFDAPAIGRTVLALAGIRAMCRRNPQFHAEIGEEGLTFKASVSFLDGGTVERRAERLADAASFSGDSAIFFDKCGDQMRIYAAYTGEIHRMARWEYPRAQDPAIKRFAEVLRVLYETASRLAF